MIEREDLSDLRSGALATLFYIADYSYVDCGWVARGAALAALLPFAKARPLGKVHDLIAFTCVLLHQQLSRPDGRDNLVLALRLFFSLFCGEWLELALPFARCLDSLLDFCASATVLPALKSTVFDILIDFVAQPTFVVDFYANFGSRPFFPGVFAKFLSVVLAFVNIPAPVPEIQSIAIEIVARMITQMTPDAGESHLVCREPLVLFEGEAQELSRFGSFVEQFNASPIDAVQQSQYSAGELARIFFVAPGVSKSALGDFFGSTKPVSAEVLREFMALFDLTNLSFDQSIRLFLSSFRIPGEGQIVDRLLEYFSKAFFASHPQAHFGEAKAVHVCAFAWIMLHTNLHNENVLQKETMTGFFQQVKDADLDVDTQFLAAIYNSVKRCALSLEETVQTLLPTFWELLLQQQRVLALPMKSVTIATHPSIVVTLFRDLWQRVAPIFTLLFEHSPGSSALVLDTLAKCAAIAAFHKMHDILDKLVVHLSRFVRATSCASLLEPDSRAALRTLSRVVLDHGTQIQEGWKWFIELLLAFFRLEILPEEMRTLSGIDSVSIVIDAQMWQRTRPKSSSMLSIFRLLSAYEDEDPIEGADPAAIELIQECKISHIFDHSLHFSSPSLNFFMKSLIMIGQSVKPETPDGAVCMHWVMRTAIINAERILPLWILVYDVFASVVAGLQASQLGFAQLVVASIFTLTCHMWSEKKLRGDLVGFFDKITAIEPKTFVTLLPDIFSGVNVFLAMHLVSFAEFFRYKAILTILNASISIAERAPVTILHALLAKFNASTDQPGIERFQDLWIPLVLTTIHFCIKDASPEIFPRFRDLQRLLLFSGIKNQSPAMWNTVFESALFPALASLSKEIPAQRRQFPNIEQRALLMVKTVFKAYLWALQYLSELATFDRIWFNLVQCSFRLLELNDADLHELIPELLGNALSLMKESGIFEPEARQRMWLDSKALIEPLSSVFAARYRDVK
jgi:hypothetical protein